MDNVWSLADTAKKRYYRRIWDWMDVAGCRQNVWNWKIETPRIQKVVGGRLERFLSLISSLLVFSVIFHSTPCLLRFCPLWAELLHYKYNFKVLLPLQSINVVDLEEWYFSETVITRYHVFISLPTWNNILCNIHWIMF